MAKIDEWFGLNLIQDSPDINREQQELIHSRTTAREAKDYTKSDTIRDQLAKHNLTILDTPSGPVWQYLK